MKKLLTVLLILSFTYPHSATAYDGGYTGTIALLHFNSDIAGRGVCVRMNPDLPQNYGWACLSTSNPLYKEITSLLYVAYITGKSCTLYVNFAAPSSSLLNEIRIGQCQ